MEPIIVEPNYANLIRQFGNDAITHMERIRRDADGMTYEDVYGLVAATRIVLSSLNTQDGENIRAFVEFRDSFGQAAEKMFAKLNELRERREEQEQL